jgi:Flp pilus assembly pilin Flp
MRNHFNKFRKDTSGVALVEFAVFLPIFLLALAVVVEGSRIFFSYQGAVVGVRDAARYLARTAPGDICAGTAPAGGVFSGTLQTTLVAIIDEAMDNEQDELPDEVQRGTVSATWVCVSPPSGTVYRQNRVPVAQVSADFTILLPLGAVFEFNGFTLPTISHTVTDQSRIFGV